MIVYISSLGTKYGTIVAKNRFWTVVFRDSIPEGLSQIETGAVVLGKIVEIKTKFGGNQFSFKASVTDLVSVEGL